MAEFTQVAKDNDTQLTTRAVGGMFGIFFTDLEAVNYFSEVKTCDIDKFKQFFHAMLQEGIYLAPSAFEAGFTSSAHTAEDYEFTIAAADKAFKSLNR